MEPYKPRGYSVNDFVGWHEKDELVLQPRFQRRETWSQKAQSYLIATILEGFPIPAIFIREILDTKKKRTVREVVDGQQRLRAVLDYVDGKIVIPKPKGDDAGEGIEGKVGGLTFTELSHDWQRKLLSYEFSVVLLTGATDADVLDIFSRINSYAVILNPQELRNAKYLGAFKKSVYKVGRQHLEFWRNNKILTDSGIVRMAEAELASELYVAMLAGLQDKTKSLNIFYEKFEESFPKRKQIESQFRSVIDTIGNLFSGRLADSEYRRRTLFYSLFCVLFDFQYGMANSPTNRSGSRNKVPSKLYPQILTDLETIADQIGIDEPDKEYAEFVSAYRFHTNDLSQRQIRHEVLWNCVMKAIE
jgi:Protein of unknown function DUF262